MFINTKILLLIALLLFSGAAYGAYNYWQSNVPPKQAFLLQGFEQTLGALDEEIKECNEKDLDYYKKRINDFRGMDLLDQITKMQTLTKGK